VSTNTQNDIKKVGYACPNCRLLFSLPPSLGGNAAICPSCGSLLTIPEPDDGVSALGASRLKYHQAGVISKEISEATVKQYMEQWTEKEKSIVADVKADDTDWRWMLPLGLIVLVIIASVVGYMLMGDKTSNSAPPELAVTPFSDEDDFDTVKEFDIYNKDDMAAAEAFLSKIVEAKTVDELLPMLRPVEGLKEKMLRYYHGQKLPVKKLKELKRVSKYRPIDGFLFMRFELTDFSTEEAVAKYDNGTFLLDWESYVGYSDYSWSELKKKKPTKSFTLRAIITPTSYYNMDFDDDKKWTAFSLSNPNEKETLYAYVLRDSVLIVEMKQFGANSGQVFYTIKAHYPENAKTDNQVVIDEIISHTWVIE